MSTDEKKIVAIVSSTGGPKSLQDMISDLPDNLSAPVLIVQHMPKGFTASFAERLNKNCKIQVKEAEEGEEIKKGIVYIAMGGMHMEVKKSKSGVHSIVYKDGPTREGVKPCGNYMYESLAECGYDNILCVVMTGMGADGTEGIQRLKSRKKIYVIAQDKESCVIYGMPKSVVNAGLANEQVPLNKIAQKIVEKIGMDN